MNADHKNNNEGVENELPSREIKSATGAEPDRTSIRDALEDLLQGRKSPEAIARISADYENPQRFWQFLYNLKRDGLAKIHREEWSMMKDRFPKLREKLDELTDVRVRLKEGDDQARIYEKIEDVGTEKFEPEILPSEMMEFITLARRLNDSKSEDDINAAAEKLLTFVVNLFIDKQILFRKTNPERVID